MKRLGKVFLMFFLCTILICCGDDNSTDPAQENLNNFNVRIVSNEDIVLDENAVTYIRLSGFNGESEYAANTVLTERFSAQQLPMQTEIELSGDSESSVCQDLEPCQAMFYLDTLIDVDGDGWICPGDLVPDSLMGAYQSFSMEELKTQDHEVYVRTKTGSDSDCIQPSLYYHELQGIYDALIRPVIDADIEFDPDTTGSIILYGYNDDLESPSTVPIVISSFFPNADSLEFEIPLQEDPAPYVCKENYPCSVRYAFAVNVDMDGDGQICPGDLIQDYDLSSLESYTLDELTTRYNDVYLSVKTGDSSDCSNTSESDIDGTLQ